MLLRLLFVEDDMGQRKLFNDALEDWNDANAERAFELVEAKDYPEAEQLLRRQRFDGALLDLRLPGGGERLAGNVLAKACIKQYGIPAGIISGNPADIDQEATHGLLAIFNKGDPNAHENAVAWFGNLWPMMDVLSGARRQIQALGAGVFAQRVWPRWKAYEKLEHLNKDELVSIVSRQYAGHIAELLGIDSDDAIKWHPFENFIQPALQESRPHTGDLFRIDDQIWVILTPQCDMATGKTKSILMACCEESPSKEAWAENIGNLRAASKSAKDKAERYFRALVNQSEPARHFLPPLENGQPLMVDFKRLRTVELEALIESLDTRLAAVSGPFLTNLTQRFGSYVSRVGQPNIDIRHLS